MSPVDQPNSRAARPSPARYLRQLSGAVFGRGAHVSSACNITSQSHCPSTLQESNEYDPFPLVDLDGSNAETEYSLGQYAYEREQVIPARPSIEFSRDTWWDALLTFYSTDLGTTDVITLSSEQRSDTVVQVVSDLRVLFHSSIYWVSFIHLPRFFDRLLKPTSRATMQPSLIMSALAIGLFAQSSEAERGAAGRVKALKLVELAHSSLQASMTSGWVDVELIQAAWVSSSKFVGGRS